MHHPPTASYHKATLGAMLLVLAFLPFVAASSIPPIPSRTATSASSSSGIATPAQTAAFSAATIAPRCDSDCASITYPVSTVPIETITQTVITTLVVPCSTTVFVTDSTTTTQLIYSTEVITETVTSEGTVFVYVYSPTPAVGTKVYTTSTCVPLTLTSYYVTEEGSAYTSLSTDLTVISDAPSSSWPQTSAPSTSSGSGWTHVVAAASVGILPEDIASDAPSDDEVVLATSPSASLYRNAAAPGAARHWPLALMLGAIVGGVLI